MELFVTRSISLAAAATFLVLGLAGCASTVTQPQVVHAMSADQRRVLKIAAVSTESSWLTPDDLARITGMIRSEMTARNPSIILPEDSSDGAAVIVRIYRYDKGDWALRSTHPGQGRIHIDANVRVTDRKSDQVLAAYQVDKEYIWGGLLGATVDIQDVEVGFAKSVADAVLTPAKK